MENYPIGLTHPKHYFEPFVAISSLLMGTLLLTPLEKHKNGFDTFENNVDSIDSDNVTVDCGSYVQDYK